jgi:hypothetical protein
MTIYAIRFVNAITVLRSVTIFIAAQCDTDEVIATQGTKPFLPAAGINILL